MKACVFLFILLLYASSPLSGNLDPSKKITAYLPTAKQLKNWKPVETPQTAVGEDLFQLINGGAEIYQEYGFEEAVIQEYANENRKSVNVEIYRMISPASAYGLYSFKTGQSGTTLSIGQDAMLEEYYLNFWKGDILVTLTGFDADSETIAGLTHIARVIESKIDTTGERPWLIGLLPSENMNPRSVKYVKGELALSNMYDFGSGNIFGVTEGAIGNYGDSRIFIFKYKNESECQRWFSQAELYFSKSKSFFDFSKNGTELLLRDRLDQPLILKPYKNCIILLMGFIDVDSNKMLISIQTKIDMS